MPFRPSPFLPRPVLLATTLAIVTPIFAPRSAHAAVRCRTAAVDGELVCRVDPAITPTALCNDGTQPAFWVRPGSGTGIDTWVIWLEGGGHCIDQTSCAQRAASPSEQADLTSKGFRATAGNGVLSSNAAINSYFYNANTVFVHYCSSDDWSGGHVATGAFNPADPASWNFQGRAIALAAVKSLSELSLNFTQASEIVLGGSSAGGLGMTLDAHDILPLLPPAPTILLVNDAGFSLDIGEYDPNIPAPYISRRQPDAYQINYATALTLWQGRGDVNCAAQAITLAERVNCYNTALLLQSGAIALPTFVAESQIDTVQTTDELCPTLYGLCNDPTNPASSPGQYVTAFGQTMAATLVGAGTPAAYTVTSPDGYMHVILTDKTEFPASYAVAGGHTSARDVWNAWLANLSGPRIVSLGHGPGVSAAGQ